MEIGKNALDKVKFGEFREIVDSMKKNGKLTWSDGNTLFYEKFARSIAGREVNGRGLSLAWESCLSDCFGDPRRKDLDKINSSFSEVMDSIIPRSNPASKQAIECRSEHINELSIIEARREPQLRA